MPCSDALGCACGGLAVLQVCIPHLHPCWRCILPKPSPHRTSDLVLTLCAADGQVGFKKTLTKEVAAFAQDAKGFRQDWQVNGPMVPGLAPLEAVERLKKFQAMFDVSLLASYLASCFIWRSLLLLQ